MENIEGTQRRGWPKGRQGKIARLKCITSFVAGVSWKGASYKIEHKPLSIFKKIF